MSLPFNPVFMSGIARGGTNLSVMLANAHSQVACVHDPFLAIFKSFRNAAVRARLARPFDGRSPLDEYYYFDERLDVMQCVQETDLDLTFDPAERDDLLTALKARTALSSPIVVPLLDELDGRTYRELVQSALHLVARARHAAAPRWVGFNENWAIEFFMPLARAFPSARFVAVLRDVRAAVASHRRTVEAHHKNPLFAYPKDRTMLALTLSFVRCWRKHVAMIAHFAKDAKLGPRLLVLRYEDLVGDPEAQARRFCDFLGLEYERGMIDPRSFIGGDNQRWISNSSYDTAPETGIYSSTVDRWRDTLPEPLLELTEFLAGPDLEACGYPVARRFDGGLPAAAYRQHLDEHASWTGSGLGWRTDNANPAVDFGLELLRRGVLASRCPEEALVRRCFLFPEVHDALARGGRIGA